MLKGVVIYFFVWLTLSAPLPSLSVVLTNQTEITITNVTIEIMFNDIEKYH